jgi:uncharacterized membrane protein YoaK (UPF0700 family)
VSERTGNDTSRLTVRVLLALTVTTGMVDAVSYLGLGHVFTANMTGNVVLLGFGIAGAGGLPVVAPLVSLASFLVGAQLGGLLTARATAAGRARLSPALLCEGTLLLAAATLAAASSVRIGSVSAYLMIAGVALAMGIRNATVRRLGVPDLTTTVLTMTLTGLASESLRGGDRRAQARRLAAVIAMLGGAVIGALLVKSQLATPLWLAAAVAIACRVAIALLPASSEASGS